VVDAERFNIFEEIHWLCFHLEYEHGAYDLDEACDDPGCFWNRRPKENLSTGLYVPFRSALPAQTVDATPI
jgi:hypothetical protein